MKRFKIGNTIINLGGVGKEDKLQWDPVTDCGINWSTCPTITIGNTGCLDLRSTLPPTITGCGFNWSTRPPTITGCGINVSILPPPTITGCGINWSTLPPTDCGLTPQTGCGHLSPVIQIDNTSVIQNPAEILKVLKADLKTRLAEIEEQEKLLAESEAPQTLEEVEEIESQLKDALEEIGKTKNKMKK